MQPISDEVLFDYLEGTLDQNEHKRVHDLIRSDPKLKSYIELLKRSDLEFTQLITETPESSFSEKVIEKWEKQKKVQPILKPAFLKSNHGVFMIITLALVTGLIALSSLVTGTSSLEVRRVNDYISIEPFFNFVSNTQLFNSETLSGVVINLSLLLLAIVSLLFLDLYVFKRVSHKRRRALYTF